MFQKNTHNLVSHQIISEFLFLPICFKADYSAAQVYRLKYSIFILEAESVELKISSLITEMLVESKIKKGIINIPALCHGKKSTQMRKYFHLV